MTERHASLQHICLCQMWIFKNKYYGNKIRCETINLILQVLFAVEQQLQSCQEKKEKAQKKNKRRKKY